MLVWSTSRLLVTSHSDLKKTALILIACQHLKESVDDLVFEETTMEQSAIHLVSSVNDRGIRVHKVIAEGIVLATTAADNKKGWLLYVLALYVFNLAIPPKLIETTKFVAFEMLGLDDPSDKRSAKLRSFLLKLA